MPLEYFYRRTGHFLAVTVATLAAAVSPTSTAANQWGRNRAQTAYYYPYSAYYAPYSANYAPQYAAGYGSYAAGYAPSGCATCTTTCTQRVCQYVPQTSYRIAYRPVQVTSYQPVTTSDPCSGCTTTCMRPVVSCVQQAYYVPQTTYSLSCTNVTYQTPTAMAAPAAPACASCPGGVAAPAYYGNGGATTAPASPSTITPGVQPGLPAPTLGSQAFPPANGAASTMAPRPSTMTYYGGPSTPLQPSPAGPQPAAEFKPPTTPPGSLPLKPLITPPSQSPSTRTAIATPPRQWQYKPVYFAPNK